MLTIMAVCPRSRQCMVILTVVIVMTYTSYHFTTKEDMSSFNRPVGIQELDDGSDDVNAPTWDKTSVKDHLFNIQKDGPVVRAPKPSKGEPWPAPQLFYKNSTLTHSIHPDKLKIDVQESDCDVIQWSVIRYKEKLSDMLSEVEGQKSAHSYREVERIKIYVMKPCVNGVYPALDSNESYEMTVSGNGIIIDAFEVWGAIYALETLSQLVRIGDGELLMDRFYIRDFPRFKHRGVMIDTGRHFLSVDIIKKNLEAMAMNKFNVLHWHMVDDQSFPFESKVFPQLSLQGAFSPSSVYTMADIRDIIEYARLRAIRIIPEFDTPGHVQSWLGVKQILTSCDTESSYGPVDPSNNLTYTVLRYLFMEALQLFPAKTIHFGGDECSYYCWSRNRQIREFMRQKNMGEDFTALYGHYITSLRKELSENKLKPRNSIYWQEIFDEEVEIDEDDIIHVWKSQHEMKLSQVTLSGHKVILSSCWYLNYVKYGPDWKVFYMCDPHTFPGHPEQKKLVLGGEACMWGEFVDDTNLLQMLWPRASAVAERLWSAATYNNLTEAGPRLEEQRCRLVRNGIPASPNGGPSPDC